MTVRRLSALLLVAGSSLVWAADKKESLQQARAHYRQAVSAHGANSREARDTRRSLREDRRSFHAERRQQMRGRHR